jgi:hypothetical protein
MGIPFTTLNETSKSLSAWAAPGGSTRALPSVSANRSASRFCCTRFSDAPKGNVTQILVLSAFECQAFGFLPAAQDRTLATVFHIIGEVTLPLLSDNRKIGSLFAAAFAA